MRLQRYPEGSNAWTLFVWTRHPAWSATWTHGLDVSMERKGAWDGPRPFIMFRRNARGGWYFRIGRLHGGLQRQSPMMRTDQRLRDDLAYANKRLEHAFERIENQAKTIDRLMKDRAHHQEELRHE